MSSERATIPVAAALFAICFVLVSLLVVRAPVLYDGDSYYHLAVARLYAEEGLFAKVPWPRMSLLAGGGDKELLFHVALIPAAIAGASGGRVALALINAVIAMLVGVFAWRRIGPAGAIVPLWLWIAAPPFLGRAVRLRPELFALLLILLAITVRPKRRDLWLGVLALLFTWTYTAFHVFLLLCVLWFFASVFSPQRARSTQRPLRSLWLNTDWSLIAMPAAGTLLGLLVRPYPLANLHIWFVQNVSFFINKGRLDVGAEITPPDAWYLTSSILWVVGAIALVVIGRTTETSKDERAESDSHLIDPVLLDALIATAVFAILFAFMSRMAIYLFPLATIACLAAAPRAVKSWPRAAVLAVCTIIALPIASRSIAVTLLRASGESPEAEWRAFGRAIPKGATIVADWAQAEVYAFWAPQGRYLDVLDPVFMALPYPREYAALRRLLTGHDPDIATTMTSTLRSEYIAFSRPDTSPILAARVAHDPRLQIVRDGINVLARVDRSAGARFVSDWNGATSAPFVTVSNGSCATLMHDEPAHAAAIPLEFAPYGPSEMRIDGRRLVATKSTPGAILGQGYAFRLPPSTTVQRIEITTCRARDGVGGFYLVRR